MVSKSRGHIGVSLALFMMLTISAGCTHMRQEIVSHPPMAKVYLFSNATLNPIIDRYFIGETPMFEFLTPTENEHLSKTDTFYKFLRRFKSELYLEIHEPGYEVITISLEDYIQITRAQKKVYEVTLSPVTDLRQVAQLRSRQELTKLIYKETLIKSNVKNALIYVNGQLMGTSPYNLKLEPGTYLIEAKHPACDIFSREITRIQNKNVPAIFDLALSDCSNKNEEQKTVDWWEILKRERFRTRRPSSVR